MASTIVVTDIQIQELPAAPLPIVPNTGAFYCKDVAGVTQLFYRADDGTVTQLTPPSSGPQNFNRVDCSVNSGRVDNPYNFTSFLRNQTAGNVAGGFNGLGVGNKSILGYMTADTLPCLGWLGLAYTWKSLAITSSPLLVYSNMVVEITPGVFKIFVVDPAAQIGSPALNVCTNVLNGDGSTTTSNDPTIHYVQIVNDLVGVVPIVNLGAAWQSHSYKWSDILAVYPLARFKEAASGDGGLPKLQTTPAFMLVSGDSATNALFTYSVTNVQFNGIVV
jgi:hypothetical protein